MPPVMELVEAPAVAPVTFPKWYTEAPLDEAPSEECRALMDDVRKALLDYTHPEHIIGLTFGCVSIDCHELNEAILVAAHLNFKGFLFGSEGYMDLTSEVGAMCRTSFPFITVGGRKP